MNETVFETVQEAAERLGVTVRAKAGCHKDVLHILRKQPIDECEENDSIANRYAVISYITDNGGREKNLLAAAYV